VNLRVHLQKLAAEFAIRFRRSGEGRTSIESFGAQFFDLSFQLSEPQQQGLAIQARLRVP
jgi:hypothetical protein